MRCRRRHLWQCLSLTNRVIEMTNRQKAILRNRIIIGFCGVVLAIIIFLAGFLTSTLISKDSDKEGKSSETVSDADKTENNSGEAENQSTESVASKDSSDDFVSKDTVLMGDYKLDANFGMLLLVNAENPLPDEYDSEVRKDLVEIDPKYRNNNYVTQIHKDVYPYITAMVANAQKEGVDLKVWSPFRSYAIQKDLFQKQVNRVGGDEEKAATVVARPGTSEHNTGLCADFNMASDAFENTEMYRWMKENAEDYGFVMRYRKDKQPITGVIHESWHWRVVGINHAKQMNQLHMCLVVYVEWLVNVKKDTKAEKIID